VNFCKIFFIVKILENNSSVLFILIFFLGIFFFYFFEYNEKFYQRKINKIYKNKKLKSLNNSTKISKVFFKEEMELRLVYILNHKI
jgi:hypothetical protein